MMTLNSNKQKMYYSLQMEENPIYETDDNGDIIYIYVDGVQVPVETGDTEFSYSIPQEFWANISFGSNETTTQEFGIDMSAYDAVIVGSKEEFPFTETTLIWYESEPRYKDMIVDKESADYRVVSVKSSLNGQRFLLAHFVN